MSPSKIKKKVKAPPQTTADPTISQDSPPGPLKSQAELFEELGQPTVRCLPDPSSQDNPKIVLGWSRKPGYTFEMSSSGVKIPHLNYKADSKYLGEMLVDLRREMLNDMAKTGQSGNRNKVVAWSPDTFEMLKTMVDAVQGTLPDEDIVSDIGNEAAGPKESGQIKSSEENALTDMNAKSQLFWKLPYEVQVLLMNSLPAIGEPIPMIVDNSAPSDPIQIIVQYSKLPDSFVAISFVNGHVKLGFEADKEEKLRSLMSELHKIVPELIPEGWSARLSTTRFEGVARPCFYTQRSCASRGLRSRPRHLRPKNNEPKVESGRTDEGVKEAERTLANSDLDEVDQEIEAMAMSARYWNYTRAD